MKNIYILPLILFITFSNIVFGKTNGSLTKEGVKVKDSLEVIPVYGTEVKSIYESSEHYKRKIKRNYSPIEKRYGNFKYDINNNLIKESNGEGDSIIYTYDSNNNVVKKLSYRGDYPMDRDSSVYSYDSDNNLIKESDFICTSGPSYDFNNNGVIEEDEEGGIFKVCGSRKGNDFKYDSNNNLIEIYNGYLGGSHFYTQRTILNYDSNNVLIEELIYQTGRDFLGERLSNRTVYEYKK